jgi:hypothetical protein
MPGFQYKDVDNPGIFRNYTLRGIKNQHLYMDERTKFICSRYSLSALEAGKYYYSIGEKTEASELLKFAAELNPLLVQSLESMKK